MKTSISPSCGCEYVRHAAQWRLSVRDYISGGAESRVVFSKRTINDGIPRAYVYFQSAVGRCCSNATADARHDFGGVISGHFRPGRERSPCAVLSIRDETGGFFPSNFRKTHSVFGNRIQNDCRNPFTRNADRASVFEQYAGHAFSLPRTVHEFGRFRGRGAVHSDFSLTFLCARVTYIIRCARCYAFGILNPCRYENVHHLMRTVVDQNNGLRYITWYFFFFSLTPFGH